MELVARSEEHPEEQKASEGIGRYMLLNPAVVVTDRHSEQSLECATWKVGAAGAFFGTVSRNSSELVEMQAVDEPR
jgi:hypothetical protein